MARFNRWTKVVLAAALWTAPVVAQTGSDNPECLGTQCGSPKEEGGGGEGGGGSVWVSFTDDGKTLSYTDDADGDGVADDRDNCPFESNRDQQDGDGDAVGNACDNCAGLSNFTQLDVDGDGQGNLCDADLDGDGFANEADNCPGIANSRQTDTEADGQGDACDTDDDNDGVLDGADNCPLFANANQVMPADAQRCNVDHDLDNVSDSYDNCPDVANPDQKDTDADLVGDACDGDLDDDGVLNDIDNCAAIANREQLDDDRDELGDACDARYCVVVDPSNPDDCLDPHAPFQVHAGGFLPVDGGEAVRPPIFANRNGAAIEYTWTVSKRPEGSRAAVENPKGAVSMSRRWQYAYVDGLVPRFSPDVNGEYALQLQAKLVFADRTYPEVSESVSTLKLSVGNAPGGASCASVPGGGASLATAALGLLALLRQRRS